MDGDECSATVVKCPARLFLMLLSAEIDFLYPLPFLETRGSSSQSEQVSLLMQPSLSQQLLSFQKFYFQNGS
jgi:hypothetical protein